MGRGRQNEVVKIQIETSDDEESAGAWIKKEAKSGKIEGSEDEKRSIGSRIKGGN